ncbi:MAG: cysteine dioxygenase family protein [Flavobacteriales bacterium]
MPDKPITSIHELVQELLRHRDPSLYAGILARYAVPGQDLEPYFRWNTRHYTRTCIQRNDAFELLLICYEPGQITSIHDYDSQMAWIHPVIGEVVEERYALTPEGALKRVGELHLRPGMDDRFTDTHSIHRFLNRGPGRAVTLNLYAKPMRKWRVYNGAAGTSSIAQAGPA